jgi:hypothetical protein
MASTAIAGRAVVASRATASMPMVSTALEPRARVPCVQVDKYRPETCCVIGNYYSLKGEHEKAVSTCALAPAPPPDPATSTPPPQPPYPSAAPLPSHLCRAPPYSYPSAAPVPSHLPGDLLPACTQAQPALPVRLDSHGSRVRRAHEHSLTHSLAYSLTYLLTYSLTHSLTYSLTDSLTYLLTYSLTHLLTHLLTYSLTHLLTLACLRLRL